MIVGGQNLIQIKPSATSFFSFLIFAGGFLLSPGFAFAQMAGGPGPEACANCHKEYVETYLSHKHSMKTDARTAKNRRERLPWRMRASGFSLWWQWKQVLALRSTFTPISGGSVE